MNESRKEHLINMMKPQGIFEKDRYTAKELLPNLKIFLHSLLKAIYEETHAEIMDCKSMLRHLDELAEEYGCKDMPELEEFHREVMILSKRIRGLENGQQGEKYGRQALNRVQEQKIILQNLTLEADGERAELDFVVITHKCVFIVEAKHNSCNMKITESGNYVRADGIKHPKVYNIGQSMNTKKYVLGLKMREILPREDGKLAVPVQNIILYTNNYSTLTDDYHYEKICYCSNLPHYIDAYEGSGKVLSEQEMESLAEALQAEAVVQEYPLEIDVDKLRENLAEILLTLEEVARKQQLVESFEKGLTEDFEQALSDDEGMENAQADISETEEVKHEQNIWGKVAKISAGIVLMGAGAITALRKKR